VSNSRFAGGAGIQPDIGRMGAADDGELAEFDRLPAGLANREGVSPGGSSGRQDYVDDAGQ
jgi:hypothetical protein